MRLTGSRAYYRSTPPKMPSGLVEILEGLTREVLKNNPTDIYGFCASHMQQLLEIRDGPLQQKTMTLEEKIVKAQEKVRQRAVQRRNQYNDDFLNQRRSINTNSIKDDATPILQQEPTTVHIPPIQNEQALIYSSEIELSHELNTPSEETQHQNTNELTIKDNADLKNDIKTEPIDTECESKCNINLAESSNETSDSILTQLPTLNQVSKTETHLTKVEMLDNLGAPMADRQITHDGKQYFKEDQELKAEAGVLLQEFNEVTPDPEQHLSNPIHSINTNQDSGLIGSGKKISTTSTELEKTADNDDEQNSLTHKVNVIANDIVEIDKVHLSLNIEQTQQSNDSESIQHFVDPDITNWSTIIDNVELTTTSDNAVNGNEKDHQETNSFDISFKESPIVELQDPQINSDMLESLLETNSDSDIVTLITQDSTNDKLKQHNGFKHDTTNAELSKTDNFESNAIITAREDHHQEKTQNQNNTFDLIENINKINSNINNNGHGDTSTELSESTQIHNHDSNMNLETAAITIQKVFRTFLFKSRASTFDDIVNETIYMNEMDKTKEESDFSIAGSLNERRPHGITRMDTVLQTVNEEKSLSLSTDDSSTLSSAATVIQAHVRGFLVRHKLNSNKTVSTNSLAASNSNEPSLTSLEMDNEQNKNKTVLNIHIVPEGGNYLSRDESLITSMDLSLDSSPPSSINLHPLGYDKSERRKQLKREDAIQSISPPSNNSGKLSEDVDSVKELPLSDHEITDEHQTENNILVKDDLHEGSSFEEVKGAHVENIALETIVSDNAESIIIKKESVEKNNSDEMDVVTPFISNEDTNSSDQKLVHSGEFHDAVLPTKVSRSDTSVASEFKNVLVYFLLWNNS